MKLFGWHFKAGRRLFRWQCGGWDEIIWVAVWDEASGVAVLRLG